MGRPCGDPECGQDECHQGVEELFTVESGTSLGAGDQQPVEKRRDGEREQVDIKAGRRGRDLRSNFPAMAL